MKLKDQLDAAISRQMAARRGAVSLCLAVVAFVLLACFAAPTVYALADGQSGNDAPATSLLAAGALGGFGAFVPLRDKEGGDGGGGGGGGSGSGSGGGGGNTDDPVAKAILDKIEGVRKLHTEVTDKLATIDGEGKRLSEEFAKACKNFDGLGADVQRVMQALAKMEEKVRNVKQYDAGLDPMKRILADKEVAAYADSIFRGYANAARKNMSVSVNEAQMKHFQDFLAIEKALDTGNSPGSNVVDDMIRTEFYSLIASYGVFPQFDVFVATKKTTKLITDDTDPVMVGVDEGSAPSEATVSGTTASVTAAKFMAWIGITNELLQDSEVNLAAFLMPKFARATAYRADHLVLAADGSDDEVDMEFTGCFAGGTAVTLASGETTIDAADYEDFMAMLAAPSASVLSRPSTGWIFHPTLLIKLLGLKDENGRPIFLPSVDAPSLGGLGSILGFPVLLAHAAPSTNSASKKVATFGDKMGQTLLIRQGLELAASEHFAFTSDKMTYRATTRMATKTRKSGAFANMTTAAG